jgi:hypothetical protein
VHPFVPAVLLRTRGLDELGTNPQPEPPDAELGEAAEGTGGKGLSIVRADPFGEPVGAEESPKDLLGGLEQRAVEPVTGQEIARVGAASDGTARAQNPRFDRTNELYSAYVAGFTGLDAARRDLIWRGAVAGAAVGELTLRLAHEGRVVDTARPEWPVEGIIFVSGEDPRRAFAAEVRGTIDWKARRLELSGEVTDGYMRGMRLTQTAELIAHNLSGEMRFAPATHAAR